MTKVFSLQQIRFSYLGGMEAFLTISEAYLQKKMSLTDYFVN